MTLNNVLLTFQMMIIWKSLVSYLNENLRAGKSVNIKRFGAFTFDIATELPKLAQKTIGGSLMSDLNE